MNNPWLDLPDRAPFVLAGDQAVLKNFTPKYESHRLHHEARPEPFLGRPDAPVVLLNLNPGWDDSILSSGRDGNVTGWKPEPRFDQLCIQNLRHEPSDYPFYLLNPAMAESPGYLWWIKKTKSLIRDCGQQAAANGLLCVEFFPYHSKQFGADHLRLPSQLYGEYLVEQAIVRGAYIVIMRSRRRWLTRLPALSHYAKQQPGMCVNLKNPQNVTISPGNLPDGVYERLVSAIREDSPHAPI